MDAPTRTEAQHRARTGLALGLGAYGMWGLLPIYFKLMQSVPALAIVAHRIVWSLAFLGLLLAAQRSWGTVKAALSHRRTLLLLIASAALIFVNWLVYVYAVNSGRILAGSLGYYLNPLANILLGRFVLREPLSRVQWLAVGLAALGVGVLSLEALHYIWISLTLCISFALYGLVRKIADVDSTPGLAIETAILFLPALAWLGWAMGSTDLPVWGTGSAVPWLLLLTGVVSTIPLLLFNGAARRMRYSTLGIIQFLAPTIQFFVAVFLFGEAFTATHAFTFACIWTAAGLYLWSALRAARS